MTSATCDRCVAVSVPGNWLETALAADALTFHFQPIVNVETGAVHAHEALVRYADFSGGAIVAEAQRLRRIHAFDSYCRQKAIRVAASAPACAPRLFINFLPSSIYEPEQCLRSTLAAIAQTALQPSQVVFEVVESEAIPSVPKLLRIRDYYRAHGFGFALDDCGTGSNTLDMIREFRPEYLKLDKSVTQTGRGSMLDELVAAGADLGCAIIAEGVETEPQRDALSGAGITLMQGWFFGRPAPLSSVPLA